MFAAPNFAQARFFPAAATPPRRISTIRAAVSCESPSTAAAATSSSGTLYQVLGIPAGASCQEIKSAYRRLARECHPDARKSSSSEQEFMRIHAAYATLSDPEQRAEYDRRLFAAGRQRRVNQSTAAPSFYSQSYGRRNWETDQCW